MTQDSGHRAACPVCGNPVQGGKAKPFCSKRCADLDLHRWLGGVYRVETDETGDPETGDPETGGPSRS